MDTNTTDAILTALLQNNIHADILEDFDKHVSEIIKIVEEHLQFGYDDNVRSLRHNINVQNVRVKPPMNQTGVLEYPMDKILIGDYECDIFGNIMYTVCNIESGELIHKKMYQNIGLLKLPILMNSYLCNLHSDHVRSNEFLASTNFTLPLFVVNRTFKLYPPEEYYTLNVPLILKPDMVELRCEFTERPKKFRTNSTLRFFCKHYKRTEDVLYGMNIPYETPKVSVSIVTLVLLYDCEPESFRAIVSSLIPHTYTAAVEFCLNAMFQSNPDIPSSPKQAKEYLAGLLKSSQQMEGEKQKGHIHNLLYHEFFPQVHTRVEKIMVIARCCRELILNSTPYAQLSRRRVDNTAFKQDYRNKRICSLGPRLSTLTRKLMRNLKSRSFFVLKRLLKNNAYIRFESEIHQILSSSQMTLTAAVRSGVWDLKRDTSDHNLNKTQLLNTSYCTDGVHVEIHKVLKSQLRKNTSPEPLMIHPSQYGRLCMYLTPESERCGITRHKTIGCRVTTIIRRDILYAIIRKVMGERSDCEPFVNDVASAASHISSGRYMVCSDRSEILGWTTSPKTLYQKFVSLRRKRILHRYTGLHIDDVQNRLWIRVDSGRMVRPLIPVAKLAELTTFCKSQWFHASMRLQTELELQGFVEYLDSCEEYSGHVLTALNPAAVKARHEDFTHVEVHGCMGMSLTVSKAFANHNQGPRRMYTGNMEKRAISKKVGIDFGTTSSYSLWYGQTPLMSEYCDKILHLRKREPNGINVTVAILSMEDNQEDAWVMKKECMERGLLASTLFRICTHSVDDDSVFMRPDSSCVNQSEDWKYAHLQSDGLPVVGSMIRGGGAIVGKVTKKKGISRCVSKFAPWNMEYFVHKVETYPVNCTVRERSFVRVILKQVHTGEVGDKYFLSHGQKGTCGRLISSVDLPFISGGPNNGLVPDLFLNVCSLMRITQGLILELLMSKARIFSPATIGQYNNLFQSKSNVREKIALCSRILKIAGLQPCGKEVMRCGKTGKLLRCSVFTGMASLRALKQLSKNKLRSRDRGPINELTRQTTVGKLQYGGQKWGEMENWNLQALAVPHMFQNMNYYSADKFTIYVCTKCNLQALGNSGLNEFYCLNCKSSLGVVQIKLPYITNLTFQELHAAGWGHKMIMREREADEIDHLSVQYEQMNLVS